MGPCLNQHEDPQSSESCMPKPYPLPTPKETLNSIKALSPQTPRPPSGPALQDPAALKPRSWGLWDNFRVSVVRVEGLGLRASTLNKPETRIPFRALGCFLGLGVPGLIRFTSSQPGKSRRQFPEPEPPPNLRIG